MELELNVNVNVNEVVGFAAYPGRSARICCREQGIYWSETERERDTYL